MIVFYGRKAHFYFQNFWQFIPSFVMQTKMQTRMLVVIGQKGCHLPIKDSNLRKTQETMAYCIRGQSDRKRTCSCFRIIQQSIFLSAIFLSTGIKMLALIQRHLIPYYIIDLIQLCLPLQRDEGRSNSQFVGSTAPSRQMMFPSECIFILFNLCLEYTQNFVDIVTSLSLKCREEYASVFVCHFAFLGPRNLEFIVTLRKEE